MPKVGVARRAAAIAGLPLLATALAVVVLALYRNIPALALGLPGLMISAAALWWVFTEMGVRRAIGRLAPWPGWR